MNLDREEDLIKMVHDLDEVINKHNEFEPHNIAGVLLSRVVLLMQDNPAIGKDLVRYVWERLDDIDQGDIGNML
jgi:chorismate mutase